MTTQTIQSSGSNEPNPFLAVWAFTVEAMAIGAVPVPGASVAIVAENTAMVSTIGAEFGLKIDLRTVMGAFGAVGSLNTIRRQLFVEGARLLSWGTGPLGMTPVSALGATTVGLQTWVLGHLAIAMCMHGGALPARSALLGTVAGARREFRKQQYWLLREAWGQ